MQCELKKAHGDIRKGDEKTGTQDKRLRKDGDWCRDTATDEGARWRESERDTDC